MDELLFKAAQYMDEHGKCTRTFMTEDGRVCVLGALNMVACGHHRLTLQDPEAVLSVQRAEHRLLVYAHLIGLNNGQFQHSVAALNDLYLKTKEETVKFMMEAAEWEPGT